MSYFSENLSMDGECNAFGVNSRRLSWLPRTLAHNSSFFFFCFSVKRARVVETSMHAVFVQEFRSCVRGRMDITGSRA